MLEGLGHGAVGERTYVAKARLLEESDELAAGVETLVCDRGGVAAVRGRNDGEDHLGASGLLAERANRVLPCPVLEQASREDEVEPSKRAEIERIRHFEPACEPELHSQRPRRLKTRGRSSTHRRRSLSQPPRGHWRPRSDLENAAARRYCLLDPWEERQLEFPPLAQQLDRVVTVVALERELVPPTRIRRKRHLRRRRAFLTFQAERTRRQGSARCDGEPA